MFVDKGRIRCALGDKDKVVARENWRRELYFAPALNGVMVFGPRSAVTAA
jgi:hypothetical protein